MPKTCSICLDDINPRKNLIILNCGHHFHINCYTTFVLHKIQDEPSVEIVEDNESIKCPMCRASEMNMYPLVVEKFSEMIETELCFALFIDDIEDSLIKELLPHILSLVDNEFRFNKRNMCNIIKSLVKENIKSLKALIKEMR